MGVLEQLGRFGPGGAHDSGSAWPGREQARHSIGGGHHQHPDWGRRIGQWRHQLPNRDGLVRILPEQPQRRVWQPRERVSSFCGLVQDQPRICRGVGVGSLRLLPQGQKDRGQPQFELHDVWRPSAPRPAFLSNAGARVRHGPCATIDRRGRRGQRRRIPVVGGGLARGHHGHPQPWPRFQRILGELPGGVLQLQRGDGSGRHDLRRNASVQPPSKPIFQAHCDGARRVEFV